MWTILALAALAPVQFETPFLAQAGGKPIEAPIGHLAPIMYDYDRDGLLDLAVGTFDTGGVRVYRNIGTRTEPKFDAFAMVEADGKEVRVESG